MNLNHAFPRGTDLHQEQCPESCEWISGQYKCIDVGGKIDCPELFDEPVHALYCSPALTTSVLVVHCAQVSMACRGVRVH